MHKSISTICAAAALAVGLGAAAPASAASMTYGGANYQQAQLSFSFGVGNDNYDRRHFQRRGDYYYYNGHRGYRDRRPGFRFYNGFWFPQSAFSFGFSVGGDRDRGGSNWSRHVAWCEDHYRSYRASDNTFQPYHGPRQECRSPYSR